jgi:mRNA-degrading endonuclease toxin of MazEF toxin-antitoxin module
VPKPEQGRIILAEVADPDGRSVKTRPAVIVSRTDEIQAGGGIVCVAISSSIPNKLPDDWILLPFHPAGKTRTGLKRRCAAKCNWLFEINEDRIVKYIGVVPPLELDKILACLDK